MRKTFHLSLLVLCAISSEVLGTSKEKNIGKFMFEINKISGFQFASEIKNIENEDGT